VRLAILSFVVGAWLLQQQARLGVLACPVTLALFAALLALLGRRHVALSRTFLLVAACAAGFAWSSALAQHRLAQRLAPQWEGRDVVVTGVVRGLARLDERALRFQLDVESILPAEASGPRRIALSWYRPRESAGAPSSLQPGERWRLTVRLKRVHGNANPHGFDFERWALEHNIGATGYVRERGERARLAPFVWRAQHAIDRARARIQARFAQVLGDAPYAAVLTALAVGEQRAIGDQQWRVFWRSGIGHLVSISGLHVTMLAALGGWCASWLWRRSARLMLRVPAPRVAIAAGALAGFAYALLAGFSVPTQRTAFMLAAVAIAWWFGWTTSATRVLCAALGLVVLIDPWAVSSPGFWLSFGAVAAIFYVSSGRTGAASRIANALRVQAALTLALAPLLIALFHQFPLISPLANAIAIPIVSLAVVPLTLLGALLPMDAPLHLAHAIFAGCMQFIEWLTQWRFALWTRAAPPWWALVLGVGGVVWMLLPRGFPARWLGIVWCAPLVLIPSARPAQGDAWVALLDVGQGLAVVVETARHTLLYDAGPRYTEDASAGARIVLPFLRSRGLERLDGMVVSHADDDHAGGASDVQNEMRAPWLLSSLPAAHALVASAAKPLRCEDALSWTWDGVRFDVLGPPAGIYAMAGARENALSCVVKVSAASGRSVLLPGDIEALQERDLIERHGARLASDVLVAAHHGSKTSSTEAFLRTVGAENVVFAVGYRNRFQHPHADVLQRVQASGARVLRSDRDGAVEVRIEGTQVSASTFRAQAPRYWRE
jgi:competence protein ComEC